MTIDNISPKLAFSIALTWLSAAVLLVIFRFGIFFETNDDVGMMMLAHGYGLTSVPTSLLLYSSRLQGEFIHITSWFVGNSGYSVYLFICLVLSGALIIVDLTRLSGNFLGNLAVVSALWIRPIFAPQFTIIASMLIVAALLTLMCAARFKSAGEFVLAGILLVLGFSMRPDAAAFIVIIALPVLVASSSIRSWSSGAAIALSLIAVAAVWWYNWLSYESPEWHAYNAMNLLRFWFTDFRLDLALDKNPSALASAGWSANDLAMISHWWFFDPDVYSPDKVRSVVQQLGATRTFSPDLSSLGSWLSQFVLRDVITATAIAALTIVLVGRYLGAPICMSIILFLVVTIVFTLLGRLNVTRVTYSGLVCICMLLLTRRPLGRWAGGALIITSLVLGALTVRYYVSRADASSILNEQALEDVSRLPQGELVLEWAGNLPYEQLYPAFPIKGRPYPVLNLFSLGDDQLAPHSYVGRNIDGSKILARLRSSAGLGIIANDELLSMLGVYCRQHWNGSLRQIANMPIGAARYSRVSCL
ncbi:hypothetical protein OSH11_13245 [Kaistia dalseonensis]|uniref:Glycosyltransferase RgtA/B/C/D-like domain-containing protein n=1 Tax=Kaistia dalseonensis TaxID=410840 RepID=A0ABU0H9W2_9HYPH|nr:hypothetical protein [Kaistia dalseonensis]MCX5495675.1 hypothetical protein [Kaistia dalseonensis]MDQ0438269.1 hypothetical protein [Kaistia dalseonensis]